MNFGAAVFYFQCYAYGNVAPYKHTVFLKKLRIKGLFLGGFFLGKRMKPYETI